MASAVSRAERKEIARQSVSDSADTFRVLLLNDSPSDYTTASTNINLSTDIITIAGNNYAVGTRLLISTSGSLSPNLTAGAVYFVVYKSGDDIRVSATPEGSAINFTNQGTGTYTFEELNLIQTVSSVVYSPFTMADLVRKELASYQGMSTRPTISTTPDPTEETVEGSYQVAVSVTLNNPSGAASYSFDSFAICRNATTTPGNTTGIVSRIETLGSVITVAPNESKVLDYTFEFT